VKNNRVFFLSAQPFLLYLKLTHKIATRFGLRRSFKVKYILKHRQVVHVILNSVNCSFSSILLNMIQVILHFLDFLLELVESHLLLLFFYWRCLF
jgi:hypothetical protein